MPIHPWQYPTAGFLSREWHSYEMATLNGIEQLIRDKAAAAKTEPIRNNLLHARADVVDCQESLRRLMSILHEGPVQSIALFAMRYASARERAGIRLHSQSLKQHRKQTAGNINRGKKSGSLLHAEAMKRQTFFEAIVKSEKIDLMKPGWRSRVESAWRRNADGGTRKLKVDLAEVPGRTVIYEMRRKVLQK